ncbi:MAG: hypothetical protein KUG69_03460 [Marinosulfonomonas sp.]|nr:hypothetical protein [Marinosulfonomonas sp.]
MEEHESEGIYLGDGDWLSWDDFGDDDDQDSDHSHLAKLEREAELRWQYPNADISLIPFFQNLLGLAEDYYDQTKKHLHVYGDIGELFGAIRYGIKLHRNYAQGSDGRLGDDFVEIKTITPFKKHDKVEVRLDRHFSKILVVKIDNKFRVSGRLVDRKVLGNANGKKRSIRWDELAEMHG